MPYNAYKPLRAHYIQSTAKLTQQNKHFECCCQPCTLISCLCCMTISTLLTVIVIGIWFPWVFSSCSYNLRPVANVVDDSIHTIAFGSCASNNDALDILSEVHSDVFIFLGDNIYADTNIPWIMQIIYNRLSCKPAFQQLVDRTPYILSTWDDHDYGFNDAGKDNSIKLYSQRMFLDFFRVPQSVQRSRQDGIYGSYQFHHTTGGVKVILLDMRFNRDSLQTVCPGMLGWSYCPAQSGTFLGETQWNWLKQELKESQLKNALTIIASSTQFAVEANGMETWANFPHERQRLLSLINPNKTLVISGDVHWGEITVLNGVIDITSSGISEVDPNVHDNPNRVGPAFPVKNYGFINLDTREASLYTEGARRLIKIQY